MVILSVHLCFVSKNDALMLNESANSLCDIKMTFAAYAICKLTMYMYYFPRGPSSLTRMPWTGAIPILPTKSWRHSSNDSEGHNWVTDLAAWQISRAGTQVPRRLSRLEQIDDWQEQFTLPRHQVLVVLHNNIYESGAWKLGVALNTDSSGRAMLCCVSGSAEFSLNRYDADKTH